MDNQPPRTARTVFIPIGLGIVALYVDFGLGGGWNLIVFRGLIITFLTLSVVLLIVMVTRLRSIDHNGRAVRADLDYHLAAAELASEPMLGPHRGRRHKPCRLRAIKVAVPVVGAGWALTHPVQAGKTAVLAVAGLSLVASSAPLTVTPGDTAPPSVASAPTSPTAPAPSVPIADPDPDPPTPTRPRGRTARQASTTRLPAPKIAPATDPPTSTPTPAPAGTEVTLASAGQPVAEIYMPCPLTTTLLLDTAC